MPDLVYDILSLGAGVQSSTLLLMSCRGELPKLDAAIFADTQWEPPAVYEHLEWLKLKAADAGIPLHTVTAGNLRQHTLEGFVRGKRKEGNRYASLPLRVLNQDGSQGMIRRQCTREYKIEPIERFIRREIVGLKPRQRMPKDVLIRKWMGISADEVHRARNSPNAWELFVYPLLGFPDVMLPRTYGRAACLAWLARHFPGRIVPRSACVGCPFHSAVEWQAIRSNPTTWADAVEVDEAIRHADGMSGEVFLHNSCKPLKEAVFDDSDQMDLWGSECEGMCGV